MQEADWQDGGTKENRAAGAGGEEAPGMVLRGNGIATCIDDDTFLGQH